MFSSLGTIQSMVTKCGKVVILPSVTLSVPSGANVSYNLNYTNTISGLGNYNYTKTGYKVYFINNTITPSNTASGNVSGTFTLTVTGATTTVYYAVSASGGGGGGGNEAGGGASSGELKYGSITLPIGTYNCSCTIGTGGYGCPSYMESATFISPGGTGGYGYQGVNSTLVINGTTITANKGCPGGPSHMSNTASGFVLGGGAGTNINTGYGTLNGATGSTFSGGTSISMSQNNYCTGGSSGASNEGAGIGASTTGPAQAGMMGQIPTPTTKFPVGLQFNQTCYFAEGGHGSNAKMAASPSFNPTQSTYKLAGANGQANSSGYATDSILGSGGSGANQNTGVTARGGVGNGGNGFILLSF